MAGFNRRNSSDTRADSDTHPVPVFICDLEASIPHRLNTGHKSKLNKAIHSASFFNGNVLTYIELWDCAGYANRIV